MQFHSVLFVFVASLAWQAHAISLRAVPAPAPAFAPSAAGKKGVGSIQGFAHLMPFHPRGQQELLMKTRCVNFLNHLLEKSAYTPDAVGALMPKCKWKAAECKALKDDLLKRLSKGAPGAPGPAPAGASAPAPAPAALVQVTAQELAQEWSELFQPWPERGAPQEHAVTWINGPRGPQPNFVTEGGMDESIYGWCDKMYDMMRTKAIGEIGEEEKKREEQKKKQLEKKEPEAKDVEDHTEDEDE